MLKLGGSLMSDKRRPLSFRGEAVTTVGRVIARSGLRVVIVHGGGAFGHPVARRFGLSSASVAATAEGVAETRKAMLDLNLRVCNSLLAAGVKPYAFSPFTLLQHSGRKGLRWLCSLLDRGLTPVTFGDVVLEAGGFRIVSGDRISLQLSRELGAERCVFVLDVDGVFDGEGTVIERLDRASVRRMGSAEATDVTGGIASKVREAMAIADSGTEVAFVSGFRPRELAKALKGLSFHGSLIRVPSSED